MRVAPAAHRQLKKLPRDVQERLARAIDELAERPRLGAEKLAGVDDLLRRRVGDYRIVYQVSDRSAVVLVVRIRHRRDVYRN